MTYKIVIGNKNYSSWSMRPWLVLDHFGFDYEEELIPLNQEDTRARILHFSPPGRVPCLLDGSFPVWESLAIIEYLAEARPDAGIWPADPRDRARARSLSAEMASGFLPLRRACPMNLRKQFRFRPRGGAAARKDVERFENIVRDQVGRSGGPFLFGTFGGTDAMYAPLCTRLQTYAWPVGEATRKYVDAVMGNASVKRWREAALKETWVIPADEVK